MKLCLWCKELEFSNAEADWSDVTPGSDASLGCQKNHWDLDFFKDTRETLVANFEKAETCKDWTPIDAWKEKGR